MSHSLSKHTDIHLSFILDSLDEDQYSVWMPWPFLLPLRKSDKY